MIKPFLTIQERCRECSGRGYFSTAIVGTDDFTSSDCHKCKGKGTQTAEITPLKEPYFEKCNFIDCSVNAKGIKLIKQCFICKNTGYQIPFKDYEIKKVSEIMEKEIKKESFKLLNQRG